METGLERALVRKTLDEERGLGQGVEEGRRQAQGERPLGAERWQGDPLRDTLRPRSSFPEPTRHSPNPRPLFWRLLKPWDPPGPDGCGQGPVDADLVPRKNEGSSWEWILGLGCDIRLGFLLKPSPSHGATGFSPPVPSRRGSPAFWGPPLLPPVTSLAALTPSTWQSTPSPTPLLGWGLRQTWKQVSAGDRKASSPTGPVG